MAPGQPDNSRVTAMVAGTGSALPPDAVTNLDLYEIPELREAFDTDEVRASLGDASQETMTDAEVFDAWAKQVTGIAARRRQDPSGDGTTESMAAAAGRAALDDAGMGPADLDMLLVATLTSAEEVPNAACTVAEKMGVPELGGYAFNAACAGFVYGMATGWSAIVSGMARNVLVVSSDSLTRFVDYADPRTAVLFGDGAGAALLTRSEVARGETVLGVLGPPSLAASYQREPLQMDGLGWLEVGTKPLLHMKGGARILRRAVTGMHAQAEEALQSAGLDWRDVQVVIPHQANLRITKGIEKMLRGKGPKVIHNIRDLGNMSGATVAIALDQWKRGMHGPRPEPATVVLTAIGGGYTSAAMVLRV